MAKLKTLSGVELYFSADAVISVMNYDPLSKRRSTHIVGVLESPVDTDEDVEAFLRRLGLTSAFIKFSSATDVFIWLKLAAVTAVRPPIPGSDGGGTGAGIMVAGRTVRVLDKVPDVIAALAKAGVDLTED
jgi:hypothetical protein